MEYKNPMSQEDKNKKLEELKKQREEIDKMIEALMDDKTTKTGIPYSDVFKKKYGPVSIDRTNIDIRDFLQLKLLVNKRCNQISNDYLQCKSIAEEMIENIENDLFRSIFAYKLLEQGKLQVSTHLDSYKSFSYVLSVLEKKTLELGPEKSIVKKYIGLMIRSNFKSSNELKGIHAIYFGYLVAASDIDSSWFWIASILNCSPSENSGYVLELYLEICGNFMVSLCKDFVKILQYIEKHYLKEINNEPVVFRISTLIKKYYVNGR